VVIHPAAEDARTELGAQNAPELSGSGAAPGKRPAYNLLVPAAFALPPRGGHPISALENVPVLSYILF